MVATNDDLLKELKNITELLKGMYAQPEKAEIQINKII